MQGGDSEEGKEEEEVQVAEVVPPPLPPPPPGLVALAGDSEVAVVAVTGADQPRQWEGGGRQLPLLVPPRRHTNDGFSGCCMWWATARELHRVGNNYLALKGSTSRNITTVRTAVLANNLMSELAEDVMDKVSEDMYERMLELHSHPRHSALFPNRERHISRLRAGQDRVDFGRDFDVAMASLIIGVPIYTIRTNYGRLCNRYDPRTGEISLVDANIRRKDIVIVNSGCHWMPTEIIPPHGR